MEHHLADVGACFEALLAHQTRTGDAVNCRGLQQGTGSTFRGVPQLPC